MQLPDDSPRLPKLPFLVGDGVLLITAWFIASHSEKPLHTAPLLAIVVCVARGAVLAAIPFLTDYARQQDLATTERQRALEALARTTADAAEQISIAAAGLHTIAEQARKNLESIGQLPQQLQEKITAVNQRLVDSAATENETLRKELKAFRAAESDKLEAAADKIARIATDFTRLESALREQAAAKTAEPVRTPVKAPAPPVPVASPPPPTAPPAAPAAEPAPVEDAPRVIAVAPAAKATEPAPAPEPAPVEPVVPVIEPPSPEATASAAAAAAHAEAHADEMLKVFTKEEVTLTMPPFAPRTAPSPTPAVPAPAAGTKEATPRRKRTKPVEGADSAAKGPPVTPAATKEVAETDQASSPPPVSAAPSPPPPTPETATTRQEEPLPPPTNSNSPMFELSLDDDTALSPTAGFANENFPTRPPFGGLAATRPPQAAAQMESSISSDGFTRLLATAYIGIGNKLFLRGEGPGLSWDKGVPLQFVSIGKWRWETPDATAPVTIKLYKNDQQECAALGSVTLEPGRQHEITADF
jgi:hypothetical protein